MTPSPYTLEPDRRPNQPLFILILIIFLGIQYQRQSWPFDSKFEQSTPHGDREDVQPDEPDSSGGYLVVVEESEARSASRIKILNNHQFWHELDTHGLQGYRLIDPDSSDADSFIREAAKLSISPPFVMLVATDGKVLRAIPFPETMEPIEELLK